MPRDPLTDIVRSLRLRGGVFLDGEFTAPWAIVAKVTEEDCRPFLPVPRQVIAYHVVTEGEMLVTLEGRSHRLAKTGDVVFLPTNARHVLSSAPGLAPESGDDLMLPPSDGGLARIRVGGNGARTHILCGFIASEADSSPLLEMLPPTLIIGIEEIATRRWLEASMAKAAGELSAGRISSATVMSQLSELLLVEALRAYLESDDRPSGWLAGLAVPGIARALSKLHTALSETPTVEDLASEAGMSRSAFVQRFSSLFGVGPGRYLLRLRIAEAEMLLRDTDLTMSEIASRIGYDAPEAFSRAFKREIGKSPAEWRADRAPG